MFMINVGANVVFARLDVRMREGEGGGRRREERESMREYTFQYRGQVNKLTSNKLQAVFVRVCVVCVRACVRACVCTYVRTCVCACVRVSAMSCVCRCVRSCVNCMVCTKTYLIQYIVMYSAPHISTSVTLCSRARVG